MKKILSIAAILAIGYGSSVVANDKFINPSKVGGYTSNEAQKISLQNTVVNRVSYLNLNDEVSDNESTINKLQDANKKQAVKLKRLKERGVKNIAEIKRLTREFKVMKENLNRSIAKENKLNKIAVSPEILKLLEPKKIKQ